MPDNEDWLRAPRRNARKQKKSIMYLYRSFQHRKASFWNPWLKFPLRCVTKEELNFPFGLYSRHKYGFFTWYCIQSVANYRQRVSRLKRIIIHCANISAKALDALSEPKAAEGCRMAMEPKISILHIPPRPTRQNIATVIFVLRNKRTHMMKGNRLFSAYFILTVQKARQTGRKMNTHWTTWDHAADLCCQCNFSRI